MERQECDHQPVAQLRRAPEAPTIYRKLSLLDEGQPGLDQRFARDDPLEAVSRIGHKRKILFDLPQPAEIPLWRKDLGHTPQLLGGLGLRNGPPDRVDLGQKDLDRCRRDLRARWGSQVESAASVEVVEEVAVPASEIRLSVRLHPRCGAAAAQANMRAAGLLPDVTISMRPARKREGPHHASSLSSKETCLRTIWPNRS